MAKINLVLPLCFNVFNVSIRSLETNFEALRGAKNHKHKGGEGLVPPENTAYVQRKIWQRNINACPPVVVSLPPRQWLLLYCDSFMCNLFELQKEAKSSGSLLKQNFLQTRHKRNGGMSLAYRTPVRPGLVGFLSQSWYCFDPKREQIHSNEISWNLFSQGN